MIEQLNEEWKDLRQELSKDRVIFDKQYRNQHKYHNCDTRVYDWNGNWFCRHLTRARNKEFKGKLERIENIISSMLSITK